MTETISNNEKSFHILNKLILNGFYHGNISPNRIELYRKRGIFNSGGNYRIIGILNNDNKFELFFDFKFPMNILIKIAIGIGIVCSLISLAYENWILPIPFFIVPFLITYTDFKLKKKKEISLLTSKYLELYKSEFKEE
ncbi:hypothetical protein WJN01_08000 [Flavobacteriaceae bacterium SZ-1-7]|uniref:hypothetical protein n=1 Tax=Tamlana sedimenti TaxID=3134126 RepID=UPI0031292828